MNESIVSCQYHMKCSSILIKKSNCNHLHILKDIDISSIIPIIHQYILIIKHSNIYIDNIPIPLCNICSYTLNRLCVCIHCIFFGCWKDNHIHSHFKDSGHIFGIDMVTHNLYCSKCNDIVYDIENDYNICAQSYHLNMIKDKFSNNIISNNNIKQSNYNNNIINSIKDHIIPYSISPHLLGLRGLINLGNTCFMSSILQIMLNNPLLRNFFLSDFHNRFTCKRKRNNVCLACEMEFLFKEIYSGKKEPYTPAKFLYSIWKIVDNFAGYEQQDAHEFFISMLNGIHNHSRDNKDIDCTCIIHNTFGGALQSDVTCSNCNYTSSTFDPIFDMSIDISHDKTSTLEECLTNFTKSEIIDNHRCSNCNQYQKSLKRLSILTLPTVLCVHLKRFEQKILNSTKKTSKIDTFVEFPLELDMTPFTCTFINEQETCDKNIINQEYQLFGIIHHFGSLENGHYISYIRHQRAMWLKCDDAFITKTSIDTVLQTQGYLLFYIKKRL